MPGVELTRIRICPEANGQRTDLDDLGATDVDDLRR
jgi:hypothetical protein